MPLHGSLHRVSTAVNKRLGSLAGPVVEDDRHSIRRDADHRSSLSAVCQQADAGVGDRQMLLRDAVSAHQWVG